MGDAIIALLPLYAMAFYFYGPRSLVLGLISLGSCLAADMAGGILSGRGLNPRDYSSIVTGMIIPMLLPVTIGYRIVVTAALFAVLVAKYPFGGAGNNVFNPAAAGVAFTVICWPEDIFLYPLPFERIAAFGEVTAKLSGSTAHTLKLGGIPTADYMDMLLGNFRGPMGATHILVLMTCLLFLTVRRAASVKMTGAYLLGAAFVAFALPRSGMNSLQSVAYELMSGSLLFSGVFLLNDPVTSPKRKSSKSVYGLLTGVVCMLFRRAGSFEESVLFAVLVMNSFVWLIDVGTEVVYHNMRRMERARQSEEKIPPDDAADVGPSV
jgi:electron transport complex protein RnfD